MTILKDVADGLMRRNWRGSSLIVHHKEDGSPVSSVDHALNSYLKSLLESMWPGIWIVSEEEPESLKVPDPKNVAIIDPLDGTENFISGLPIWGVSVAVWQSGQHQASMLAFPEMGFVAITGQELQQFTSRIVGHPSSSSLTSLAKSESTPENRIFGCATFNLFCVSTGRLASFANRTGAYAWDILAGLNLALGSGCGVTVDGHQYRGEFLDPSKKYSFSVHR